MNLIIDIGNTFAKVATFQSNQLQFQDRFTLDLLPLKLQELFDQNPTVGGVLISSVVDIPFNLAVLDEIPLLINLSSETAIPFTNEYLSKSTLGVDRIALMAAAVLQYPNENVLVIDAGTCITYDLMMANATYTGGAISPGLRLRYRALNNFTSRLPNLDPKLPNHLIGGTTEEAIHSGIVNGVTYEIAGAINSYREMYPDLTVILTGGDSNFLSKQLKNGIFANSNFLLEGLNHILEFNKNQ